MPEIPNLDALAPEELDAASLTFAELGVYAARKRLAIHARSMGDIAHAQRLERECDRIYTELPAWARW